MSHIQITMNLVKEAILHNGFDLVIVGDGRYSFSIKGAQNPPTPVVVI